MQLMLFDGPTFDLALDGERLTTQSARVFALMADSKWRTLGEIQAAINMGTESSISARLRDFRKVKFGGHVVNRRRRGCGESGCFEYQLEVAK